MHPNVVLLGDFEKLILNKIHLSVTTIFSFWPKSCQDSRLAFCANSKPFN